MSTTIPIIRTNTFGYEKEMADALAAAWAGSQSSSSDWETLVSALQRDSFDVH